MRFPTTLAVVATCVGISLLAAQVADAQTLTSGETFARSGADHPISSDGAWEFVPPSDSVEGYLRSNTGELFRIVPVASRFQQSAADRAMTGGAPMPEGMEMPQPVDGESMSADGAGTGGEAGGGGGSDNGTNPAQNTRTAIFSNSFYHLDGGNDINTTYLRLKYPTFGGKGSFLVEIPFNYYDLETPVNAQVGGLGDIKFQFSQNLYTSVDKRFTFISFMEMYIPSADNVLLTNIIDTNDFVAMEIGSGKYVLGPGIGTVFALRKQTIFAPLYFYEASVAGLDSRPDINRGKWRIFLMNAWENGMYVLPELNITTNYHDGATDAFFAPEVGFSKKGTTFYVKPGIGISPDENERAWGFEFGARVAF